MQCKKKERILIQANSEIAWKSLTSAILHHHIRYVEHLEMLGRLGKIWRQDWHVINKYTA